MAILVGPGEWHGGRREGQVPIVVVRLGLICYLHSLKLTANAPENGWLEYDPFLLGRPIFRCELLVSGRLDVCMPTWGCLDLKKIGGCWNMIFVPYFKDKMIWEFLY